MGKDEFVRMAPETRGVEGPVLRKKQTVKKKKKLRAEKVRNNTEPKKRGRGRKNDGNMGIPHFRTRPK